MSFNVKRYLTSPSGETEQSADDLRRPLWVVWTTDQLWPAVYFFQIPLSLAQVTSSLPAGGSQLPWTPKESRHKQWLSQVILDSWRLHSLIASSLHEHHWQECLQLWSWRRGCPFIEMLTYDMSHRHLAPVWPLSIPSLADSWLVKFLLKPVPVSMMLWICLSSVVQEPML